MLRTRELEYDLPEGLIAREPAEPRDAARMLVVSRRDEGVMEHRAVRDLPEYLRRGDALVVNTTRVLPAWLEGHRAGTGGKFSALFLRREAESRAPGFDGAWVVMVRARHVRAGAVLEVEREGKHAGVRLELLERVEDEAGAWVAGVRVDRGVCPVTDAREILERVGEAPIPPYIRQARKAHGEAVARAEDRERYQTTYSRMEESGSVAAPTAGLHLTPGLLAEVERAGVERIEVRLDVGMGTFKGVEREFVEGHPMHEEWCWMTAEAVERVRRAQAGGGRVFAVGTTSVRTLETYAGIAETRGDGTIPEAVATRLLIAPGHRWRWVDGVLTNFHLPRSTLLALVGALFPGGMERVREIYAEAIRRGYRFYSYGDAMLVLP